MSGRDHGGNLDAAIARFGGHRADWIDLSTGINPKPYPVAAAAPTDWTDLPDQKAQDALLRAARQFWSVPDALSIVAAPGASALIAQLPRLSTYDAVRIPGPTYNEHAASFEQNGWRVQADADNAQVLVHPNNPDGRLWQGSDLTAPFTVIDESFCDVMPDRSLLPFIEGHPGAVILKSFGKFWGLAGLRLGFAIGAPDPMARLAAMLGPWPVSGPALRIGAAALADTDWAEQTRGHLEASAQRLDRIMEPKGADLVGGTSLFRLYKVPDAAAFQARLAAAHIWSRTFPYSRDWVRLGLPPQHGWDRLEAA